MDQNNEQKCKAYERGPTAHDMGKETNASNLRAYLKPYSGENLNKCNQCDYSSYQMGHLRTHLKFHSGEKLNKCNQCDYATLHAHNLRRHLQTHSGWKAKQMQWVWL